MGLPRFVILAYAGHGHGSLRVMKTHHWFVCLSGHNRSSVHWFGSNRFDRRVRAWYCWSGRLHNHSSLCGMGWSFAKECLGMLACQSCYQLGSVD